MSNAANPESESFYALLDDREQYRVLLDAANNQLKSIEPDDYGRFLHWQLERRKKIGKMILDYNKGLNSIKKKLQNRNSLATKVSKEYGVSVFCEIVRQNVDRETWEKIHREYKFRTK